MSSPLCKKDGFLAPFVVVSIIVLMTVPWLSSMAFYTHGEPREAIVAQTMLDTGNWILPRVYGDNIPSKPPLLHWLIAALSPSGKVTEFSARLPSAMFAALFGGALFAFVRRYLGIERAWWSVAILYTSGEWFRAMTACRVDMVLAASFALALLLFLRAHLEESKGELVLGGAALALAALAKGPVAILLAGVVSSAFLLLRKQSLNRILPTQLLFLLPPSLVVSAWYYSAWRIGGHQFIDKAWNENVARLISTMADKPHEHGAAYLIGAFLLGTVPWSLILLLPALKFARKPNLRELKKWWNASNPAIQFSCIVVFAVLAFFAVPSSKRGVYLLPCYPFLAILFAQFLHYLDRAEQLSLLRAHRPIIVGLVLLSVAAPTIISSEAAIDAVMAKSRENLVSLAQIWTITGALFLGYSVIHLRDILVAPSLAFRNISISYILFLLQVNAFFFPAFTQCRTSRSFAAQFADYLGSGKELYAYGYRPFGVSFYTNRTIKNFDPGNPPKAGLVLLHSSKESEFKEILKPDVHLTRLGSSTYGVERPDAMTLYELDS